MSAPADDEWEYEYDPVLTEDFYIPIDLSNVPTGQKHVDSERRTGHPTLLKSRLRALNAQRGQQQQQQQQQQDVAAISQSARRGANNTEAGTQGSAQIIGLHTENPLVVYNGQLLSLQWAATIGTDMFFAQPRTGAGAEAEADTDADADAEAQAEAGGDKPLRSLPGVDLMAVSSAKLVARVGRLRPRDELLDGGMWGSAATAEAALAGVQAEAREPSTGFLARVNAAKARRGDSTRLAIDKSGDGSRVVCEAVGEDVEMGGV